MTTVLPVHQLLSDKHIVVCALANCSPGSPQEERKKAEWSPPWGMQFGSWPEQLQNVGRLEFHFNFHTKISQTQIKPKPKEGNCKIKRNCWWQSLNSLHNLGVVSLGVCLSYLGPVSHPFWGLRAFCTSGSCEGPRTSFFTVSGRLFLFLHL